MILLRVFLFLLSIAAVPLVCLWSVNWQDFPATYVGYLLETLQLLGFLGLMAFCLILVILAFHPQD